MLELTYTLSKHLHVWCVTLSFLLFVTRAAWQLKHADILQKRWVKILPHVVDTFLLLSGITLLSILAHYQAVPSWLMLKIPLVVCYIVVALIAFKVEKYRKPLLAIALLIFSFIVYLAVTKPAI